jgi:DNA-binding IscR family transcriptional regulator
MSDIAKFIQARHIDSFQKLHLLIFLHQHPEMSWTSQQMAERLYLGDVPWLEKIIADLQAEGLVDCAGNRCKVCD